MGEAGSGELCDMGESDSVEEEEAVKDGSEVGE